MKIGYQGMKNSNSEEAAQRIASRLALKSVELVPLISSANVIETLMREEIDYGVVATENSIGGLVAETEDALKGQPVIGVTSEVLEIHHCLFVKNRYVRKESISAIASHPQALKQCKVNLEKLFSKKQLIEIEDTAIGARYLSKGQLYGGVAVLCKKSAGEAYGLHLFHENLEDQFDNCTTFKLYKKR